jgi:hypothetical protein
MKTSPALAKPLWRATAYYALELMGWALGFLFVASAFFNIYFATFYAGIMILGIAYVQSHYYPEKKFKRRK